VQKEYLLSTVHNYFQLIRGNIEKQVDAVIGEKDEITPKEVKKEQRI